MNILAPANFAFAALIGAVLLNGPEWMQ